MASALVYRFTPVAIRIATHYDFFDKPGGYKGHGRATPYLGGAAVMAGVVADVLLLAGSWDRTLPVVGGVAILWVLGTIDDRRMVSPAIRVAVEATLATALWSMDLGWDLGLGAGVDWLVTVVWMVAVINALNLFDNMDGQAATIAGVSSAAVSVLGALNGDTWLAVTGAALAGACLGFLPYNLASPARIFLGDGGSMPLGFVLSAAIMALFHGDGAGFPLLLAALILAGLPVVDTALVMVSRRRARVPLLSGGTDHLTHRLA